MAYPYYSGGYQPLQQQQYYQHSSAPDPLPPVVAGGSDFFRAVSGRDPERVWAIMDDLMETLNVVNPRVYRSVMEQVKSV